MITQECPAMMFNGRSKNVRSEGFIEGSRAVTDSGIIRLCSELLLEVPCGWKVLCSRENKVEIALRDVGGKMQSLVRCRLKMSGRRHYKESVKQGG